jgi:hypothetical protein
MIFALVNDRAVQASTCAPLFHVSEAGKWSLALRIAMTSKEKVEIAAPILIE